MKSRIPIYCFLVGLLFLLNGCTRNYFYAQQGKRDRNFLASSHVHTPDPRQKDPPEGATLLIYWAFPLTLFEENLTLVAKVRFWDGKEEETIFPIVRKRDSCSLFFQNQRILTYLIQATNVHGIVVAEWKHHFWTEWIDLDEMQESAQSNRDSVSSQLKQESVIETP